MDKERLQEIINQLPDELLQRLLDYGSGIVAGLNMINIILAAKTEASK